MTTQADLHAQMKAATLPEAKRDAALALLQATYSRQYLDDVLLTLNSEVVRATLDDSQRPILREKSAYYFQHPDKDKAGMLREGITRLLVHIGHHDDLDVYLQGVLFYQHQPVNDVAQNLRAAALAGIATVDMDLACLYAARLIGEPDTSVFNCEPTTTAVQTLVQAGRILPVYQFALRKGVEFASSARGEAVAVALESLGADFPAVLYEDLARRFIELDEAVTLTGIIDYITNEQRDALYPLLEQIITQTRHEDLHRYGAVMLAASRRDDLTDMLYRLARLSPHERLPNFIEAVELSTHPERDDVLASLRKRL